jgi:uncharacterized membrane protein
MIKPVVARRIILWASLAGLFVSTYLLITYVSGKPIVCGALHGCEVVRASKWAYSFGLPRPLLGVIFYTALIALLAFRGMYPHWHPRNAYRLMMLAATIGFIESAFLTFVQWLDIRAFCIWCVTSAVMATVIFAAVWFDKPIETEQHNVMQELKFLFWSFVAAVIVGAVAIFFLLTPSVAPGSSPELQPAGIPREATAL